MANYDDYRQIKRRGGGGGKFVSKSEGRKLVPKRDGLGYFVVTWFPCEFCDSNLFGVQSADFFDKAL